MPPITITAVLAEVGGGNVRAYGSDDCLRVFDRPSVPCATFMWAPKGLDAVEVRVPLPSIEHACSLVVGETYQITIASGP